MKNPNQNPDQILETIKEIENMTGQPQFDLERREDIRVQIRASETIGPAMFRPDPLIPGGYLANSLTIRAMRPDIFVLGESIDDLSAQYSCRCGEDFDVQFWKLCPYCGHEIKV